MTELFVTNFNPHFTGVSATAAAVLHHQAARYDAKLVGYPLPGLPPPISYRAALKASRHPPTHRPFVIWHVRRNAEMQAAIWARDVLRLPIRIVFTSAATRRHSTWPRWLISKMDAVIATSEQAAGHVPHVRAIIPHGVDTARLTPATNRRDGWAGTGYPGTMGLATIGRIRPEKGTDRFVQAMLHLLPCHPDLTALVIGRATKRDQAFFDRLQDQTRTAGLTERLIFTGELSHGDLTRLLPALSCVVQLPRYEGYGMAPLEGMAAGVPFVVTDKGHYRAFAQSGSCGVVLPDFEAKFAADRISTLLNDPTRLETMAIHARHSAETNFSITREEFDISLVYDAL